MSNILVAVRPDAVVDYEYEGVTFKIGIVPQHIHAKWLDVATKQTSKSGIKGEDMYAVLREIVKWAIKGHSNFKYADGEEVEFKQQKHVIRNKTNMLVSDETLDVYYSSKVIQGLSMDIVQDKHLKKGGEVDTD